jgi:hypothetical protein
MPRRNADCNPLELAYALLIKLPGVDPKTIEECPFMVTLSKVYTI